MDRHFRFWRKMRKTARPCGVSTWWRADVQAIVNVKNGLFAVRSSGMVRTDAVATDVGLSSALTCAFERALSRVKVHLAPFTGALLGFGLPTDLGQGLLLSGSVL